MNKLQIKLRPIKRDDAVFSVKWRNDSSIWRHTINSPNRVIKLSDEYDWMDKILQEDSSKRFAIIVEDCYVGNVQLTNIENKESYFGIFIGEKKYLGKGVGTKATRLILDYGFTKLGLNKVKLRVRELNKPAVKVYKNLGFKEIKTENQIIHMELLKNSFTQN